MVVACLALIMALGGTSYAAVLAANSVGTKQLKRNAVRTSDINRAAVTSVKVKDFSLLRKDFKSGQIPAGPAGPAGASALNPVPSGQTIRGVAGGDFHEYGTTTGSDFGVDVTLPIPAANGLADTDVSVNVAGWQNGGGQLQPTTTDTNAACTGTPAAPTAPAGHVCIYVSGSDNAQNITGYSVLFGTGASPYGFKLKWDSSAAAEGDTFVDATWAYTAP